MLASSEQAAASLGMGRAMQMAQVQAVVAAGLEPVIINGRLFQLEVAATPAELEHGLMQRDHLAPDGGMVFVYAFAQRQSFWMANCLIDLDILFLDSRGRIVKMYEMKAEPLQRRNESQAMYHARLSRYVSGRPAQFAVEVQAGMIRLLKLKRGDVIYFDRKRLVTRHR